MDKEVGQKLLRKTTEEGQGDDEAITSCKRWLLLLLKRVAWTLHF